MGGATRDIRKRDSMPILRELMGAGSDTTIQIFTDDELHLRDYDNRHVHIADEWLLCVYFVTRDMSQREYKFFRAQSEIFRVRLVPYEIMKDALERLMPIPRIFRCDDLDVCRKCGIIDPIELLRWKLDLGRI